MVSWRGIKTEGPMAPEISMENQRPAQYVFDGQVQQTLSQIRANEAREKAAKAAAAAKTAAKSRSSQRTARPAPRSAVVSLFGGSRGWREPPFSFHAPQHDRRTAGATLVLHPVRHRARVAALEIAVARHRP